MSWVVESCKDFGDVVASMLIDFTSTPTWLFCSTSQSLILHTTHTGPGLDFNPIQTILLASGGTARYELTIDLSDCSFTGLHWGSLENPTRRARSTKLCPLPGISRFSIYLLVPAVQVILSSGTLLLWRTVVELGYWLVRLVLGWPLEEDLGWYRLASRRRKPFNLWNYV